MSRATRAGWARLPAEAERYRPLYARLLGLRVVNPGGVLCFLFFEGAVALAVLLALAELVTWWAVVILPVAVAVMVKLNDLVAAVVVRSAARVPEQERDRFRRQMEPVVGRAPVRATGTAVPSGPFRATAPAPVDVPSARYGAPAGPLAASTAPAAPPAGPSAGSTALAGPPTGSPDPPTRAVVQPAPPAEPVDPPTWTIALRATSPAPAEPLSWTAVVPVRSAQPDPGSPAAAPPGPWTGTPDPADPGAADRAPRQPDQRDRP